MTDKPDLEKSPDAATDDAEKITHVLEAANIELDLQTPKFVKPDIGEES